MISIVICSVNEDLLKEVSANIALTIGEISYEIITIDNNVEQLSIFQAYNKGSEKSQYPNLIFLHEDILFKTKNWGGIIVDKFKNKQLGLLGIVGTKYKSKVPSGWYTNASAHYGCLYYNNGKDEVKLQYNESKYLELVVAVDGLFMATTKKVFNECRFDEESYKGFHFYDLDYSTTVISKGYKVAITNQLSIFHKSQGNKNSRFYKDMFTYQKKWEAILPLSVIDGNQKKIKNEYEWSSYIRFTRLALKFAENSVELKKVLNHYMPKKKSILYIKYLLITILKR